jgi:hypothetical protein
MAAPIVMAAAATSPVAIVLKVAVHAVKDEMVAAPGQSAVVDPNALIAVRVITKTAKPMQ